MKVREREKVVERERCVSVCPILTRQECYAGKAFLARGRRIAKQGGIPVSERVRKSISAPPPSPQTVEPPATLCSYSFLTFRLKPDIVGIFAIIHLTLKTIN